MRTWDLDDLAGLGDLAREWGVGSTAVANLRSRHDDFPAPLLTLSTGPVYSRAQLRQWRERHAAGDARVHQGPADTARRRARWAHIIDDLRARIQAGEWAPGERIPSRVALSAHYGVSGGAIAYPISVLRREGLLTTTPASGTYVAFIQTPEE